MQLQVRTSHRGAHRPFLRQPSRGKVPHERAARARSRPISNTEETASAAAGSSVELPTRMNNTPHDRAMRRWFYNEAAVNVRKGIAANAQRMRLRCTVPELNPEMDVYRVGTLLELVREIAAQIAEDGKRVKVCVQASMGQGVFQGLPLSLSGVSRIMKAMDWGDAAPFVGFGAVSAEDVDSETDVYILIAPQNVVGSTIMTNLGDMVEGVEAAGKHIVLVNPILKDIPSSAGIMGVRGRDKRIAFAESFVPVYHFRLLYFAGSFYPIQGALRFTFGERWQVYKRINLTRTTEEYQLWGEFDTEPQGKGITACMSEKIALQLRGKVDPDADKKKSDRWW